MKKEVVYFVFLSMSFVLFSQEIPENSIEMEMAKAFCQAFNAEDIMELKDFTLQYRTQSALDRTPIEERLEDYATLKGLMGTIELGPVYKYKRGNLKVYISDSKDEWYKLGLKLGKGDLLESISIMGSGAPKQKGIESTDESTRTTDLKTALEELIAREGIPGISLAIIRGGQLFKSECAGIRNVSTGEMIRENDRFHIGSITKSFTASLVGKLIQENKLSFETTLGDLFQFDIHDQYQEVSIRQLLNHQGGIPGYLQVSDEEEAALLALPGSPSEQRVAFAKMILQQPPAKSPGSGMNYSNAGYSILASICEIIDEQSWETQIQRYIFDELNMKAAGFGWPTNSDPSQPEGHYSMDSVQNPSGYFIGPYLDPAGDIHSSMNDLAQFAIAHMNGLRSQDTYLTSETIMSLLQLDGSNDYTAGWLVDSAEDGSTVYYSAGSAGTFFAYLKIYPQTNEGYVIAANIGLPKLIGVFDEFIDEVRLLEN